LDENIEPKLAIEMAGLTFSNYKNTTIDPQYLELLQKHTNVADEELGLGNNIETKGSSRVQMERYETWIQEHLNNFVPP
jgi:hypothetical protein